MRRLLALAVPLLAASLCVSNAEARSGAVFIHGAGSNFINDTAEPSFVIDVSMHYERKWAALACYRSQFEGPAGDASDDRVSTRLTAPVFRTLIESRDAQFGTRVGVAFAEGVVVREPIVRGTLFKESRGPVLSERSESKGPT